MRRLLWLLPWCAATVFMLSFLRSAEPAPVSVSYPGDLMVILDAGHGGADGGASAPDGTLEAELNLKIVQQMREVFGLYGIIPVLTRTEDSLDYPPELSTIREKKVWDQKTRLARIQSCPNAVLLSVHQNQYENALASGAQVLWAPTDGSESLAVWLQSLMLTALDGENHRAAAQISGEIYLMNRLACPAVLVECGFLSNSNDLRNLQSPAYRTRLAAVLVTGYITWAETYGGT